MIYLNPVNLMVTSAIAQPVPLPRPSKNLQGKKAVCRIWIWSAENLRTHPRTISVSMNADSVNAINTSQESTKEGLYE